MEGMADFPGVVKKICRRARVGRRSTRGVAARGDAVPWNVLGGKVGAVAKEPTLVGSTAPLKEFPFDGTFVWLVVD